MHIIHSLDPPYLYRPLGFLRLHHGASPTRVYELVGHREGLDPKLISKLAGFEAAYEAYRRQSWDHAAMLFQAVDEATQGGDTASRVYLAKCKAAGKQVSLGVTPGNFSKDGIEGASVEAISGALAGSAHTITRARGNSIDSVGSEREDAADRAGADAAAKGSGAAAWGGVQGVWVPRPAPPSLPWSERARK